ncbi:MAG: helix-turn-helix transcriptional regulator [Oscillospiraceae bacterium]|nr:helix-turn-helix transcriptional regulator [Oscillospiraceae bacterium]
MLNENIRKCRKAKGLSQEELALQLNVVRQTLSKWEKGLSVPDSQMLIRMAEALDVPVSRLLGETAPTDTDVDTLKILAVKLEVLNEQYSRRREQRRRIWRVISIGLAILAAVCLIERAWVFGTLYRVMTNPNLGDTPGIEFSSAEVPAAVYQTALYMGVRMMILPVCAGVLGLIGIHMTKKKE